MEQETTIVVVDDDRQIAQAIARLLQLEGYRVVQAHDGVAAVEIALQQKIQLIILDIMMPKLDGLSALMKIRDQRNIPIILLSAKSEDSDKIIGLSLGADDYVTKPFHPQELVARVKSQLRRYLLLGNVLQMSSSKQLVVGGLTLHLDQKQLYVDGEAVRLTPTEFKIMELLMRHVGVVFSAEHIYERCWNGDAHAVENTVMVHIRRIREKIEINPKEPKYLKVVWGIGYKMENYK